MSELENLNISYARPEPIKHIATWKSHDLFDMQSEYGIWTDCDDRCLELVFRHHGVAVEFTNERPPRERWWRRIFKSDKPT